MEDALYEIASVSQFCLGKHREMRANDPSTVLIRLKTTKALKIHPASNNNDKLSKNLVLFF